MTDAAPSRRPLWQAALLGGVPPVLVAWALAVALRQYVIGMVHGASAALTLSGGTLHDIGVMLLSFVVAFLGVQILIFLFAVVAERHHPRPTVAWLCAGVIATTPLVLYSIWPDANVPTWQIIFVYFFGIAAAWITRRLRHGAWL